MLSTKPLFVCLTVEELLPFVDGLLRSRDGLLQHVMQWNALCRAFELRSTSGDLYNFICASF